MRYRRADIEGATYFFTVNLAERGGTLLVDHIALLDSIPPNLRRQKIVSEKPWWRHKSFTAHPLRPRAKSRFVLLKNASSRPTSFGPLDRTPEFVLLKKWRDVG